MDVNLDWNPLSNHEEMFLKKPWTFATNIPATVPLFKRLCNGEHNHVKTQGADTIATQYYTPAIVHRIHLSIFQHFFPTQC